MTCTTVDTCAVSDVYCPFYEECVPSGAMSSGTCSEPDRSASRPATYEVKAVIPQTGVSAGWNFEHIGSLGISVSKIDFGEYL